MVLVDARSGEKIRTRDVLWRADLSATLFDPNPVVSQGSYSDLLDAKDRDSTLLTSLRVPVSLPRITSAEGCLVGVYADARLGKRAKPVCRPSLDFTGVTAPYEEPKSPDLVLDSENGSPEANAAVVRRELERRELIRAPRPPAPG